MLRRALLLHALLGSECQLEDDMKGLPKWAEPPFPDGTEVGRTSEGWKEVNVALPAGTLADLAVNNADSIANRVYPEKAYGKQMNGWARDAISGVASAVSALKDDAAIEAEEAEAMAGGGRGRRKRRKTKLKKLEAWVEQRIKEKTNNEFTDSVRKRMVADVLSAAKGGGMGNSNMRYPMMVKYMMDNLPFFGGNGAEPSAASGGRRLEES